MSMYGYSRSARSTKRPSTLDIAWAAGIYEGEGTFYNVGPTPYVSLPQKDTWILLKLRELFGGHIYFDSKGCSKWRIGSVRAIGFVLTIYKFLSPWRRDKIREIIAKRASLEEHKAATEQRHRAHWKDLPRDEVEMRTKRANYLRDWKRKFRKRVTTVLVAISMVVPVVARTQCLQPCPTLYGYLKGSGYPLLQSDGRVSGAIADSMSKFSVVILDAAAPKQRPDMLDSIRTRNPKIKLLAYVVEGSYWTNAYPALGDTITDYPWHVWQAIRSTGGPLYATNGTVIGTNVANPVQMSAIADTIIQDVIAPGHWDGLFVDVACPRTYGIHFGDKTVDLARMGFPSAEFFNSEWSRGSDTFIHVLRSAVGDSFPIIGNCGPSGQSSFNGWMREAFPTQGTRDPANGWNENMLVNGFGQPGYLTESYLQPHFSILAWEPGYTQGSSNTQQRERFTLGSACLGNGSAAVGRHEWEPPRYWWFKEYATGGWLGEAADSARVLKNGLWERRFQRGLVAVNPTSRALSIYLDQLYQPIGGGAWKRAFSVPAQDALFLKSAR